MERGKKVLDETFKIINGERKDSYGKAEDSFNCLADLWNIYIKYKYNNKDLPVILTKEDSAMMMALLKVAREINQHKFDNLVDLCGYIALLGDMRDVNETSG